MYIEALGSLIKPIENRSGMIINSPFKYLGSKKRLMIAGYNPGDVPDDNKTTINEDWLRHTNDESFNALHDESWGKYLPGYHPIQIFYKKLIDNTDLTEMDILYTNVFFQRSQGIPDLVVDSIIEKQCKKVFLLNLEIHKPDAICFLGDDAQEYVSKEWASVSLACGEINYPWSDVEGSKEYTIKFYRMEFGDTSINVFSVPHQSKFRIGSNPQYWKRRLEAILIALNRSLN